MHLSPQFLTRAVHLAVLALACASANALRGEGTLWCRPLGAEEGLSQSFVTAIAQDRAGFLWFGTLNGLNRWDGREFATFTHEHDDPASLSEPAVLELHAARDGSLWVGTGKGLDRFDPTTGVFRRFTAPVHPKDSRRRFPVEGVVADRVGRAWFASYADPRLFRADPRTGRVTEHLIPGLPRHWVTALFVDQADRLWVATQYADNHPAPEDRGFRLWVFDRCSEIGDGPMPAPRQPWRLDEAGGKVVSLLEDASQRVWLGRNGGGLLRLSPQTGETARLAVNPANPDALASSQIRSLALDPAGEIWALTTPPKTSSAPRRQVLYRVDPDRMVARRSVLQQAVSRMDGDAQVQRLAVDRSGVLWLGTGSDGLRYADVSSRGFSLHRAGSTDTPGLRGGYVRAICRSRDGRVWVGTPLGLNCLDRSAAEVAYSFPSGEGQLTLPNPNVQALCEDREGKLWIGTASGLVTWAPAAGTQAPFQPAPFLRDAFVQVIHAGSDGTIWVGTLGNGLAEWHPSTREFRHHVSQPEDPTMLPGGTVYALLTDAQGRLWVGTDSGLARLNSPAGPERRFERLADTPDALRGVAVLSLCATPASPAVLWLGTQDRGLCRFDERAQSCRFYTTRNSGLPNNTVYGVLADRRGRLWLSTDHGLACFDPAAETFRSYGPQHGLQSFEFNGRASWQGPDGEMFFGGVAGLNTFFPEQVTDNPRLPIARLTAVRAFDRAAQRPERAPRVLHRLGASPGVVTLPYRERDVTFEFVALHFSDPAGNRCFYQLAGYDRDWRGPAADRQARYTNLDPGRYTFRVRARSSHGVWSEAEDTFAFVVLPPFYATTWFRVLAVSACFTALGGGYRWRVRNLQRRQRELEQQVARRTEELRRSLATVEDQAGKLRELDAAKSKFFANISHEFRTPLMLTLGPVQDVRSGLHGTVSADAVGELDMALRNARRLLELVDQLRLLARFDARETDFHPRPLRLDEFLRESSRAFESLARQQRLQFRLELPPAAVEGRFDESKLHQVLGNLLGNAFKFTPVGGAVTLRLTGPQDGWATFEVEDTGPGIPARNLPRIFERFYRGEQDNGSLPGTGLGLAVAAECVRLHGGEVCAENRSAGGARFTIRLPSRASGEDASHSNPEPKTTA